MASQPPADAATPTDQPDAENSAGQLATLYTDDAPRDDNSPPADAQPDPNAAPADDGEPPADEQPPIEAPTSWAKDAKDVFAALPREAQEIVAKRERDRDAFVQAKSREAAQTRQTVETEARSVIQRQAEQYAQQLEAYIPQLAVTPPDIRYLQSENPEHHAIYNQQQREYQLATAQRDTLTQQAQQARAQAEQVAEQQRLAALQVEAAEISEKFGVDWSDPSSFAKLQADLEPIAAELGYTQEVIAQAGVADLLALRTASEWKAKAAKYDQLQKAKMIPVRDARALPPAARPGAPAAQQAPKNTLEALYPNDVRR